MDRMQELKIAVEALADPYWLGSDPAMTKIAASLKTQAEHAAQKDAALKEDFETLKAEALRKGELSPAGRAKMRKLIQSANALSRQCIAMQKAMNTISDGAMPAILEAHLDAAQIDPNEKKQIIATMLALGENALHTHDNLLDVLQSHREMQPATLTKTGTDHYSADFNTCLIYLQKSADKNVAQLLDPATIDKLVQTLYTPAFGKMYLLHCSLQGINEEIQAAGESYREFSAKLSGGLGR